MPVSETPAVFATNECTSGPARSVGEGGWPAIDQARGGPSPRSWRADMLTNVSSGPRRHHFIPRLLLKGFASKVSGDKCFVYQFRVGAEPKELSAMDVGLERDFHGRTAEIEQRLSNKESIYGPLIRRLRDGHLHSGDETLIAEFVTDLIVRTKNVRGGLAEAGVAVFENFETQPNDPSNYAALEERLRARATRTVLNTKKIRKKLRKRFGSRSSEMAEQLVDQMCKTLPLEPVEIAQYLMRDARNRTDIPAMRVMLNFGRSRKMRRLLVADRNCSAFAGLSKNGPRGHSSWATSGLSDDRPRPATLSIQSVPVLLSPSIFLFRVDSCFAATATSASRIPNRKCSTRRRLN